MHSFIPMKSAYKLSLTRFHKKSNQLIQNKPNDLMTKKEADTDSAPKKMSINPHCLLHKGYRRYFFLLPVSAQKVLLSGKWVPSHYLRLWSHHSARVCCPYDIPPDKKVIACSFYFTNLLMEISVFYIKNESVNLFLL
jgi:hypothetical protein